MLRQGQLFFFRPWYCNIQRQSQLEKIQQLYGWFRIHFIKWNTTGGRLRPFHYYRISLDSTVLHHDLLLSSIACLVFKDLDLALSFLFWFGIFAMMNNLTMRAYKALSSGRWLQGLQSNSLCCYNLWKRANCYNIFPSESILPEKLERYLIHVGTLVNC